MSADAPDDRRPCLICGLLADAGIYRDPICGWHFQTGPATFAAHNRIMCDFFHRGIEPKRLPPEERQDDD